MAAGGAQEAADCLGAELWASSSSAEASATAAACRRAREASGSAVSFRELFSDHHSEVSGGRPTGDLLYGRPEALADWLRSLRSAPGLVDARLRPLHTLLPLRHPRRRALREAEGYYVRRRGLRAASGPGRGACGAGSRLPSACCSRRRGEARATVVVWRGRGWRGDYLTGTDAYVRVALGGRGGRTGTVWNREQPAWGARLELGWVLLAAGGARLRLEVWDDDGGRGGDDDDLLGACEVAVEAGASRNLVCFPGGGRLEFGYRLSCGPALGGPACHDYVPQGPAAEGGGWEEAKWPPDQWGQDEWLRGEEEEEEVEEEEVEEAAAQRGGNQHGSTGHQHGASGNQHGASGHQHEANGNQPGGNQPGATGHQHGASGHQHAASGNQHKASGNQHAPSGNQPGATGHQHRAIGHQHEAGGSSGDLEEREVGEGL